MNKREGDFKMLHIEMLETKIYWHVLMPNLVGSTKNHFTTHTSPSPGKHTLNFEVGWKTEERLVQVLLALR